MAKSGIIVTGDKQIDRVLAGMPDKMQKKPIRKATRETAKVLNTRLRPEIPELTGAMRAATQVRSVTRTIKRGTGVYKTSAKGFRFQVKRVVAKEFGAKVEITRKSLAKQLTRRGKPEAAAKVMSDKYFYPALVELGGRKRTAEAPMRRTTRAMEIPAVGIFQAHLRRFLLNPQ